MAEEIKNSIQELSVSVGKIQLKIKELTEQGKSAKEIFDSVKDSFSGASKMALALAENTKDTFKPGEAKKYIQELNKLNTLFGTLISSQKSVAKAAEKANQKAAESAKARGKAEVDSAKAASDAYEAGFKKLLQGEERIKKLQEDVALKNIQLSKKANIDKLQDVVSYYDKVQSEYKKDSEEYLKIEKKKLDAQIKLQKESDSLKKKSSKAAVEDALKSQKDLESKQKALRDKIAARNKVRTKKVLDFETAQAKRRADVLASIEKRKEKERTAAVNKGVKDRAAAEKSADFKGGFRSQITPKAIGGALGSLTKYLGLYQAINAAQRVFTELTIGSVKQSIDFQKALANLGAVAGASSEEVKQLGENALKVAGSTQFTAQEIIVLQTELSKLGFTANDVVASTQAIAFTAQALGSPLGETAAQVGKVVNQFDLLIEQAGFIGDVLVTSINNSALSFDSFGTAIQYVGPIAKNLGLTFQQTAGAMAVLADNGFTASRIGTGLRGIFTELGKTSADVETSLKSLAEQNISLSEAVDLVGKRNAAQLITLLDNIDAVTDANDLYYQQGRALESAAINSNTFSGQLDILTSNFREFQIEIGKSIVQSDLLLGVLDAFFPKGAETARAFKAINEIGFKNFNNGAKDVSLGANATTKALELLGIETEKYEDILNNAVVSSGWDFITSVDPGGLAKTRDEAIALKNDIEGLTKQLEKQGQEILNNTAITSGQKQATDEYEESVKKLTQAFSDQVNVNDEVDAVAKRMNSQLEEYNSIIDSGFKTETDVFGTRSEMVELTEEEILKYKGLKQALEGYIDQLTNITFSEDELNNKRAKQQSQALSKDLKRIKQSTQEAVDAANERAKVETKLAGDSADERADIERERTLEVQGLYRKQAAQIRELSKEYDTQKEKIEQATAAAEKQAEILGSEVISDASSALKEFSSEFDKIKDDYIAGNIGLEEYNEELAKTQTRYREYIEALIGSSDLSEDAIKVLRRLADAYDNVSSATEATEAETKAANKAAKDAKKTWEDFTDELKKTGWQEIAKDAVKELGEVLDEFNKTQLDNTIATEQAKLEEIRNRYSIEEQIIKSQLENQLLTESQFRKKVSDLRKSQIAEENSVLQRQFNAQKKADVNNARLDGVESAAQSYLNAFQRYEPVTAAIVGSIGAAIAIASANAQIGAINQRAFVGKKFADGGVVNGPSHDQGGVPFTVQGQGGYEMEGGEYIVNKRSTSMYRGLLEQINSSARPVNYSSPVKFANGGVVNNISNVSQQSNESVDYLKAIAEATTSTAIGVSRPVRAFVADKDLRSNSTERRIRDRNDRI